ncbi:MAG: hypothetical protein KDM63_19655 [Verrucomicrobiae bacterium]|nr:hypothetical protein [Verrucomicrobiae bacterium]MCB1089262.1 hypothetical protein [Verrucomicrobiae bacterium]
MKTILPLLFLALTIPCQGADERQRLTDLEEAITAKLHSEGRKEFFEMFYFSSSLKHQEAIHQEIHELFARHFKSGIGKVTVRPLTDEDFHEEVMGSTMENGVFRAPGPPFAYLAVYPADKKDPDYMGLNFRLAKIDGTTRIVFPQYEEGVHLFLDPIITTWERIQGDSFEARLVRVIDGKVYFRSPSGDPLVVELTALSSKDQERVKELDSKAK